MPVGQVVSFIDPEYSTGRWVGIKGVVRDILFFHICRSQQDVEILGDWKRLLAEARDSHWMMAYGDWLREMDYAAWKIGVRWVNVSQGARGRPFWLENPNRSREERCRQETQVLGVREISFGHFSLFFLGCCGISVVAYDEARHDKRGPATDGEAPGGSPGQVGRGGGVCSGVGGPDEAALCPALLPPLPRGRPSPHLGADGQLRRQDLDGVPRLRPRGRGSAFERELPAVPGLGRADRRREPGPLDRPHTVC